MKPPQSRILHPPPPGRPNWKSSDDGSFDLLYLAWGSRNYGRHPSPLSAHDGWSYLLVISGKPTLLEESKKRPLRAGALSIISPDRAYGLSDKPKAACRIISWIWATPPTPEYGIHDRERPLMLSREQIERLTLIHGFCREETARPDRLSGNVLAGLRKQLDASIARVIGERARSDFGEWRLHLAMEWLRKQMGTPDPIRSLCDYLQVSNSTLNRLFHSRLKSSPQEYIHRTKMEYALSLRPHRRLKEIAYLLGYRHPNDLSRALSLFESKKVK